MLSLDACRAQGKPFGSEWTRELACQRAASLPFEESGSVATFVFGLAPFGGLNFGQG